MIKTALVWQYLLVFELKVRHIYFNFVLTLNLLHLCQINHYLN